MHTRMQMKKLDFRRVAAALALGVAMFAAGLSLREAPSARADVTGESPRQQFMAGGERSEVVLREISATLKRIDARLERIERAALDAAKTK
jgi:hypothetical protein